MSDRIKKDKNEYLIVTEESSIRSWPEWKKMLVSAAIMVILCGTVMFFDIPNPNMILITGLVIFTSIFGYPSGIVCGVFMLIYSMWFFSTDHSFIHFSPLNLQKMAVIVLGIILNLIFVGQLKKADNGHLKAVEELNRLLKEDNAALERASMVDALTGLRNRFALRRDYPMYEKQIVHVMMMDVDDFKEINDKFGHNTGDYVLRNIGAILSDLFGEDSCYRYGGDEFLVIKRNIDEKTFEELTNRIIERTSKLMLDGERFPVSVSGGFVFGAVESPGDLRFMFRHADNKLYEAKKLGKNRIVGRRYKHSNDEHTELGKDW